MKQSHMVVGAAVVLGLSSWVADAYVDYTRYYPGTFLELLILDVPPHEVYIRSVISGLFLIFGLVAAALLERRGRDQEALRKSRDELEVRVSERTAEIRAAKERLEDELTRRISAEERVSRQERFSAFLFENSADIVIVVDEKGVVRSCSPSVSQVLGYAADEIVGRDAFQFVHPDDLPAQRAAFERGLKEQGKVLRSEAHIMHRNGSWRVLESVGKSRMNDDDGTLFFVINSRDITARKETERHLSESEAKFERLSTEFSALLNAIPERIALLSRDLSIIWANASAASGVDKAPVDIRGQHCYSLWHNQEPACDDCPVVRAFRSGSAEDGQMTDLADRVWDVRAIPIDKQHEEVRTVMVIGTDITRRLALEAEAILNARLASVGQLAAGVAHEINNPINGIINYATLIGRKTPEGSSEHDFSARIVKEGLRVAAIVRSLLAFARKTDGRKGPVNIERLLDDTMNLVRSQILKEGVAFELAVEPGLPMVNANAQQMQQVFLNLIENSLYALRQKYPEAHEDKILRIEAEKAPPSDRPGVQLSFFDRGTGIPSSVMPAVTLPFYTTKSPGEGTGLGLSIGHGIVTEHGGTLSIDSVEGEFTRVVITLPAAGEV